MMEGRLIVLLQALGFRANTTTLYRDILDLVLEQDRYYGGGP